MLALALWLAAAVAGAQSERPALELAWSAPAECPQLPRAKQLVAEYLGEPALPLPRPNERVLAAQAAIRHLGQRWQLRLVTSLDGQPGERTLSAGTCADVVDAAALVLAFAIDPGAALRHGQASPAPPPPPNPAPSPAPPPPPPVSRRTWLAVAAGVRGDWGALPGVSGGLALALAVEHGAWAGMLTGSLFADRSAAAAERPTAGGELGLWSLAAAPCWAPAYRDTWRLRLCLPVELQRLHAEGYGVDVGVAASRSELLVGAELLPGLSLSHRLELVVPLRLAVATQRPEFYLERIGSVFRASLVQGRAGLALQARF